jgi:hypothetical protein
LNYGQSNSRAISDLDQITTPGTYTLTGVLRYNTGTTPLLVTRRVQVTIIGEVDAIARAASEIRPGTLLANGSVTAASAELSNLTSIIGVSIRWEIAPANGVFPSSPATKVTDGNGLDLVAIANTTNKNAQTLTFTRNYTDQKFFLRGTLVEGYVAEGAPAPTVASAAFTGANVSRTYEFTVRQNSLAVIQARVEGRLTNVFAKAPLFIQWPETSGLIVDSGKTVFPTLTPGLDQISGLYQFANVPTGFFVQPIYSGVSTPVTTDLLDADSVSHYVIVSGVTPSTILALSGVDQITGDAMLLLDARSGQIDVLDTEVFPGATTTFGTFKFDLVLRVLLSTDTVLNVYNVNTTKSHTITLFRNAE